MSWGILKLTPFDLFTWKCGKLKIPRSCKTAAWAKSTGHVKQRHGQNLCVERNWGVNKICGSHETVLWAIRQLHETALLTKSTCEQNRSVEKIHRWRETVARKKYTGHAKLQCRKIHGLHKIMVWPNPQVEQYHGVEKIQGSCETAARAKYFSGVKPRRRQNMQVEWNCFMENNVQVAWNHGKDKILGSFKTTARKKSGLLNGIKIERRSIPFTVHEWWTV